MINSIDTWKSLNVLVIGEAILDCYLCGSSDRLCREAPVPIVNITQRQDVPGGAANTAANVASLGANVRLLSVIGNDLEGDRLQQCLQQRGVLTESLLISAERTTLAKQRVMADSHLLVRFDRGSTDALSLDLERQLSEHLVTLFPRCDVAIISDYGYGILTPNIIHALATLQAQSPRVLVVDSKRLSAYRDVGAVAVKPNYNEAIQLLNLPKLLDNRVDQIISNGDRILDLTRAAIATVTLDTEGTILFQRGQTPLPIPAQSVPSHQATGAGDTFVSALALSLAAGDSPTTAATVAAAAAAIVVQEAGTTTCKAEELRQGLTVFPQANNKLIYDRSELDAYIQQYRHAGCQIVFTNGCFDILHPGHVTYLAQAKALGDILIVGVNSDESVQRLKGVGRPVNSLDDRLTVLAALDCIDHLVPFGELTPHHLIRTVCPNIYVKGGDYTRETLPETELVEELGGTVIILPFVGDRSTTRLIHQIRSSYYA